MSTNTNDPARPVAVLVSGYEAERGARSPKLRAADNRAIGRFGQALMASADTWSVRQLSPLGGDGRRPSRVGLKRALAAAAERDAPLLAITLSVDVVDTGDRFALVAEHDWHDHPVDTTLSLSWVAQQLDNVVARQLLVVVDVRNADAPAAEAIANALDRGPERRVIAVLRRANPAAPRPWSALTAGLTPADDGGEHPTLLAAVAENLAALPDSQGVILEGRTTPTDAHAQGAAGAASTADSLRVLTAPPRGPAPTTRPSVSSSPDLVGQELPGRFLVESEIARGAHGVVYLARQLSVDRMVAVKVLDLERGGRNYDVKHFEEEIRTLGRLDHPNLIRIYQADRTADGRLFYTMELIRGRTMEQILMDEAPLAPDRAVTITREIVSALHAAHVAGIIHSDVKPANIALQPRSDSTDGEERAILFDFGVARLTHSDDGDGSAEAIGASLGYMAPEQASEGLVDKRSDLFSAALILYEMLTGWRRRRLSDFVPPLTPAQVPDPVLLRVLRRALAFDAADRFQTARELLAALSGSDEEAGPAQEDANPFRFLSAYAERDRWRFHGRVLATAQLADLVLYNPVVGLASTGPHGKTSLLRAGLLPRLGDLRVHTIYVSTREQPIADACAILTPGTRDLSEAVAAWRAAGGRERVVIVFDQLDALLLDPERMAERQGLFDSIARCLDAWPEDVGFVLALRMRALRQLAELRRRLVDAPPVMRLGPLTERGGSEALLRPFEDRGIDVPRDLSQRMLGELQSACALQSPDQEDAVLPADLQLLGGLLYEAHGGGDEPLSEEMFEALGDISALPRRFVEEAISRAAGDDATAATLRDLLPAFADDQGLLIFRNEAELSDIHPRFERSQLQALERERLVQHVSRSGRPPGWELVNELAVAPVLDWARRDD